jgi:branched-chain amino acid transport system permease protein
MAVGAYTSAMLSYHLEWSFWAALPCATLATSLVGLIFGLPSLKIKGFYIAVATLAAHFIIIWVIVHGGDITGGVWGIAAATPRLGGIAFDTEEEMFFLIMGFAVVTTFFAKNLVRMKTGRIFVAIRDNDIAAEFMGINIFYYKVLAFAIAALYAGVAGSLLAHYQGVITVEQFPIMESIWYLGFLIVGGMGSITGAIFGAVFFILLHQLVLFMVPVLAELFPAIGGAGVAGFTQIFYGIVIILFLVFEPRGLYHRWQIIKSSFRIWPFPY